jgi:hypothetical protein
MIAEFLFDILVSLILQTKTAKRQIADKAAKERFQNEMKRPKTPVAN